METVFGLRYVKCLCTGWGAVCEKDWWSVCLQSKGRPKWKGGNLVCGREKRQRLRSQWYWWESWAAVWAWFKVFQSSCIQYNGFTNDPSVPFSVLKYLCLLRVKLLPFFSVSEQKPLSCNMFFLNLARFLCLCPADKEADCTISMSDADLLALMTGKMNPQTVSIQCWYGLEAKLWSAISAVHLPFSLRSVDTAAEVDSVNSFLSIKYQKNPTKQKHLSLLKCASWLADSDLEPFQSKNLKLKTFPVLFYLILYKHAVFVFLKSHFWLIKV